ncbi:MAG: TonB family protein [Gemmatimonadota bacterium]
MTAAVARPPLFGNLIASRPDREKNSVTATAVSLALHALVIALVVTLTARAAIPTNVLGPEPVPIEPLVNPQRPPDAQTQGGIATRGSIPVPDPLNFSFPTVVLPTIPAPGRGAVNPMREYVPSGIRSDGTRTSSVEGPGAGEQPGDIVPLTVHPRLLNRSEVLRLLERFYPPMLMQAGIAGTSIVWLRIDEEGRVIETRIKQGSGQAAFDKAALEVANKARFSPAYNRDLKVKVWVELPVVFSSK